MRVAEEHQNFDADRADPVFYNACSVL